MTIDGESEVARLCAAGMSVDGDPAAASALFMQAWESRRDDYEASIAAHFVARHQKSPADTVRWNQLAVDHAEAAHDDRVLPLLASLYLNLGESLRLTGQISQARDAATQGLAALDHLPFDGYRNFVEGGLQRLKDRLLDSDDAGSA